MSEKSLPEQCAELCSHCELAEFSHSFKNAPIHNGEGWKHLVDGALVDCAAAALLVTPS